jgi:hypothetical protein
MRTKTFDCVEMKHRGAEKIQGKIKGMTLEQELAFWQERSRELQERQEALQQKRKSSLVTTP